MHRIESDYFEPHKGPRRQNHQTEDRESLAYVPIPEIREKVVEIRMGKADDGRDGDAGDQDQAEQRRHTPQHRFRRQKQDADPRQRKHGQQNFIDVDRSPRNGILITLMGGVPQQRSDDQKQCRPVQKYDRQIG